LKGSRVCKILNEFINLKLKQSEDFLGSGCTFSIKIKHFVELSH